MTMIARVDDQSRREVVITSVGMIVIENYRP